MTGTTKPTIPAFAVRIRPKFREVVLPPGPAPLVRDGAAPKRANTAPPARDDPDRSA
ncbi:hypothetical protein [Methylobacterium radiodurans]|uniref:hypothetical protein n=1 Tax=Methylobacterium radiodurans TaxID=2202828 RepID=UPI0013A592C6|nr:hypothetical protein [Methylobacterium radiodurans]